MANLIKAAAHDHLIRFARTDDPIGDVRSIANLLYNMGAHEAAHALDRAVLKLSSLPTSQGEAAS